jgi:RNAse (barnase) inhibitor barstar
VNRRRKDIRKQRHRRNLAMILGGGLFCTCAPATNNVTPHVPQTPAQLRDDAGPATNRLVQMTTEADAQQQQTHQRINAIQEESGRLKNSLNRALTEANRLREQKSASEEELNSLWQMLTEATQRNLFLEIEVLEAQNSAEKERKLREAAAGQLQELQELVRLKDQEAAELRGQLNHEMSVSLSLHGQNKALAGSAERLRVEIGSLRGANRIMRNFLIGAGAALFISIVLNVLLVTGRLKFPF